MALPHLRLDHVRRLTDSTGILHQANWTIPDYGSGYTLETNARAFVAVLQYHKQTGDSDALDLARQYLAFIRYAERGEGHFSNFLAYSRDWRDEAFASPDSNGRAIWATGYGLRLAPEPGVRELSASLFLRALPHVTNEGTPRSAALSILGMAQARQTGLQPDDLRERVRQCAEQLCDLFDRHSAEDWRWFEPFLTYSNATLATAMLVAGALTGEERFQATARESLEFLINMLFLGDELDPIGQKAWYANERRRSERSKGVQQPSDVAATVQMLLTAWELLNETRYRDLAYHALDWFYGRNRLHVELYDSETGGCRDQLGPEGASPNEGAEATLSHLSARLLIGEAEARALPAPNS